MARLLAIIALLAVAPSAPADAFCAGMYWNDRAAELECRLEEARKAQEEVDSAASSRRLLESFPRNEITPDDRFMQELKENQARQQLQDALRH